MTYRLHHTTSEYQPRGVTLLANARYLHQMSNPTPVLLGALACFAGVAHAQSSLAFIESADKSVPAALHKYNVPGLALALIRNGAVVWMKGYGFADVASARPITPETPFNVGSLSKTATAWGVMRLVERGKVELDEPVDAYLKGWRLPPSQFDAKQVTIRRVLSHTAGISNHDYHGWDPASPLPRIVDSLSGKDRDWRSAGGLPRLERASPTRARTTPSCNS